MPGKFGGIRLMTSCFSKKTSSGKSRVTLCTVWPKQRNHLLTLFSRCENGCSELSNILHSGGVWRDDNTYQMSTGGCKFFMTVGGVTVLRSNRFLKDATCWMRCEGSLNPQTPLSCTSRAGDLKRHMMIHTQCTSTFYEVLLVQECSLGGTTLGL